MTPATVTLDEALSLLSLPRVLGEDAAGNEVTALNGRYGPYLKAGTETRSLPDEASLFTVTLDEALALFAQPKARGRRAAAAPLRELGDDPASGKPMTVRKGRFGPYVTDGETNASLAHGRRPRPITLERAAELLQDRRDRGPVHASDQGARDEEGREEVDGQEGRQPRRRPRRPPRRRRPRRRPTKKATAKRAPAKKATPRRASQRSRTSTTRGDAPPPT